MRSTPASEIRFDALLPPEMALKAQQIGLRKAEMGSLTTFALAVLAGAFIALGAVVSTTVTAGATGTLPYGITRLLAGIVFCLGLILVIVAGAELFTGNNLIVMAWANRLISTGKLLRNWGIVYLGNLFGTILTAVMVFLSGQYLFGNGQVGLNALNIARGKVELGLVQALMLGILCNALVCLAVWLCFAAHSATDKILSILLPITGFVAAGFEHSVANMYFIPVALLIKQFAGPEFWALIEKSPADYASLTWGAFVFNNLLPVTVGNIIGGAGLVGVMYWFIYLRPQTSPGSPRLPSDDMD